MKAKLVNEDFTHLKPKSKKEIEKELNKMMNVIGRDFFTVGDLKKFLENLPDNLPIGKSGHYGEFNPMSEDDFWVTTAQPMPKNERIIRRLNVDMPILQITSPDLGEDPD